jgi:type IV secretion system protein VirB10
MNRLTPVKISLLLATLLISHFALAQAAPWLDEPQELYGSAQTDSPAEPDALPLVTVSPQVATTTAPSTVTIPAGTRILMVLKSPLHTTSGTAGSGLYLETLYPVVQGNGVVIPAHTQVQGMVEANQRPGHVERTSEFRFRFTSLIFSNNFVAPINGVLQSIPGARNIRTSDKDGTLRPVDQTEKVMTPTAASSVGGAIIGSHRAFGISLLPGAGLGAALGLGAVLLKRGDEIYLPQGSKVEMVLQSPFSLEQAQMAANARFVGRSQEMNDTPQAVSSDEKPKRRKRQRAAFGTLNPFNIFVP